MKINHDKVAFMTTKPIPLPDLAATEKLAKNLATLLQNGDVVGLEGPLGTGKTTFARALLQALGVEGDVPSPTFTLLQTYDTQHFPVYHFDLYRLKSADELDELGWDDACADGVVVAEWPERAAGRLPVDHLILKFMMDDRSTRSCVPMPQGTWTERLRKL